MAFQFPAAPTIGQTFTPTVGVTYRWNGTAWFNISTSFIPYTEKAAVNGVATLDSGGDVPLAQLGNVPVPVGQKPLLNINPNFNLDQIREGAVTAPISASAVLKTLDGWSASVTSIGGAFTVQRVADPLNAAAKCLEIVVTTADAVVDAGDTCTAWTILEGFDAAVLRAGQAGAKSVAIKIRAQTTVPGIYSVALRNGAANRSYLSSINVLDTAEHDYFITVPMDIAGAWLYNNGTGLTILISFMGGTNFQTAGGVWTAGNFLALATQVNFMATLGNTFRLKSVNVYEGSTDQPFQYPSVQAELARAQRYYYKSYSAGTVPGSAITTGGTFLALSGVSFNASAPFPASMRAAPVVTPYATTSGTAGNVRNETAVSNLAATASGGTEVASISASGATDQATYGFFITADARLS